MRVAVQRLLALVLCLFMLLVPPAVAHGLDLSQSAATASQTPSPSGPATPPPDPDDEASVMLPAALPELPLPAGDDDSAGGDGLNLPPSLHRDDFVPASAEVRSFHADRKVAAACRPWSTGPPSA